jgi:hypothetical protein
VLFVPLDSSRMNERSGLKDPTQILLQRPAAVKIIYVNVFILFV